MFTADAAYQKRDFKAAFQQSRDLAELAAVLRANAGGLRSIGARGTAVPATSQWPGLCGSLPAITSEGLLSAILASSPDADLRDPSRALEMADETGHEYHADPSLWEIIAAANAFKGDFKEAIHAETRALGLAKRLGRDLTALQQRESSYLAGTPWTGTYWILERTDFIGIERHHAPRSTLRFCDHFLSQTCLRSFSGVWSSSRC